MSEENKQSLPLLSLKHAYISQVNNLVLSDVNIEIFPGDFVYLIGSTGSGKSSLLKTIYADLPLKEGNAEAVGFDLVKLKESEIPFLRRKIGIVFQDFQLLPDRSVRDNLLFVLKATGWKDKVKIDERIRYVLERVDMGTKHFKMPHQLSGGEQQRVAIARALLNDPELIIADEPTGNLDPSTSEEIMLLMKEICHSGRAILMATHDYSLILKFPSRTLKCDGGKVFETLQTRL
ncbi:MAG: ATP-binding cassette domain-containing protein [Flavobacteriales bacterium]|nr:MAG: ATP-binding cassette domain-containing protein [Flavobacteriales bacterium]